jgi:hypothetical protein
LPFFASFKLFGLELLYFYKVILIRGVLMPGNTSAFDTKRVSTTSPGISFVPDFQNCRNHGVPPIFAQSVGQVTAKWGNSISIRAGSPIPRGLYSHPGQPKSIDTHVKSSNWGFTEGYASFDERLDRLDVTTGQLRKRVAGDLPLDKNGKVELEVHPLKKRLEDVLYQIYTEKPPKYAIMDDDATIKKTGILRVREISKEAAKSETISNTVFAIKLDEKVTAKLVDRQNLEGLTSENIAKPSFWDDAKFGNFSDKLNSDFQTYFSTKESNGKYSELSEIKVFGKNGAPIVRDMDLHSISKPSDSNLKKVLDLKDLTDDQKSQFQKEIHKQHDTRTVEGTADLMWEIIEINLRERNNPNKILPLFTEQGKISEAMDIISKYIANLAKSPDKASAKIGNCTAFEVYQMMEINYLVANRGFGKDVQLNNFIQHGAENRNTYYTQPDGPTLTISNEKIFAAESGNTMAKYLNSHLEEYPGTFVVNPNWAPNSNYAQPAWEGILEKQKSHDEDSKKLLTTFKNDEKNIVPEVAPTSQFKH